MIRRSRVVVFSSAVIVPMVTLYVLLFLSLTHAQSSRMGPPRVGGDPSALSTSSFPGSSSGAPMADTPQRNSIAVNGVFSANSANLLVVNANFVRLKSLGFTNSDVGNDGTVGLGRLSISIVDATHVAVTCGRQSNAAVLLTCFWEVYSLPPLQINSIQAGFGTTVITSVNVAKSELDYLGINANNVANADQGQGSCTLTDATHVTCASTGSAATGSWRVIEWR